MFRRLAWDDVGGYSEHMCSRNGVAALQYEDWDFWVGCAERGHFGLRVPLAVLHYRVRKGSMFGQVDDQRSKAHVGLTIQCCTHQSRQRGVRRRRRRSRRTRRSTDRGIRFRFLGSSRSAGPIGRGDRRSPSFRHRGIGGRARPGPAAGAGLLQGDFGHNARSRWSSSALQQLDRRGRFSGASPRWRCNAADMLGVSVKDAAAGLVQAASMVDFLLTQRALSLPVPLPRVNVSRVGELRDRLRS